MTPSERLKNVRESVSKSQNEMATLLGINYRTYQNYENGRSDIGWDALESISKLGFDANWLLTGEGAMKRGEESTASEEGRGGAVTGSQNNVLVVSHINGSTVAQTATGAPAPAINPDLAELLVLLERYGNKAFYERLKADLLKIKAIMEG